MLRMLNTLFVFIMATIFYWFGLLMFSPLGISVNIMFAFCLIVAVILPQRYGYTFAFFSGLFLDFLGTSLFGSQALAFVLTMMLFYRVEDKIDFTDIVPQMILTGLFNVLYIFIFAVLSKIFTGVFVWQGWADLVLGSVILGILMPLLFYITDKFFVFNILKKANED